MSEELQPFSFPAQVTRRLNTSFAQPVMEAPGIGPVIGFPDLPVRLAQAMQTTVLKQFPPARPFSNLSIPGLKLADALTRRPISPVIHRSDGLQTAISLVLGMPKNNAVPVAVSTLVPGGMFAKPPDSPVASMFPGRLSQGLLGHDETLQFPQSAYQINKVYFIDDPFEFSVGSIDLTTGRRAKAARQ